MRWSVRLGTLVIGCIALLQLQGCRPGIDACPSDRFCVWENRDYGSHQIRWIDPQPDYRDWVWPGTNDVMDNEVSSVANTRRCHVDLFQHPDYEGAVLGIPSFAATGNLDGYTVGDNQASSHFWYFCP